MGKQLRRREKRPSKTQVRVRVEAELTRLELARGHDGILRGAPEPVVLLSVYSVERGTLASLSRGITRFNPRGAYPLTVAPTAPVHLEGELRAPPPSVSGFVVQLFALALEEDGGEDVRELYAALGDGRSFSVWSDEVAEPAPLPLSSLVKPGTQRVQVLRDGRDLRDACTRDDFVGAAVAVFDGYAKTQLRLPFVSADGRNDWTALVEIRVW